LTIGRANLPVSAKRLGRSLALHVNRCPEENMTCPILVIGYGNTLRQDDGFGWWVAERLIEEPVDGVEVIVSHQLTPELAEPLSRCRVAVFVDAREGEPVGKLDLETVTATPSANASFTHSVGPTELCYIAQAVYGSAPAQAYLLTVRSVHFEHKEKPSPEVEKAVERATAMIRRFSLRVAGGESPVSLPLEGDRLLDHHDVGG
jgi:hydrogenase maturation protease